MRWPDGKSRKQQLRAILLYSAVVASSAISAVGYFYRSFASGPDKVYYEGIAAVWATIAILWGVGVYRRVKKLTPPTA